MEQRDSWHHCTAQSPGVIDMVLLNTSDDNEIIPSCQTHFYSILYLTGNVPLFHLLAHTPLLIPLSPSPWKGLGSRQRWGWLRWRWVMQPHGKISFVIGSPLRADTFAPRPAHGAAQVCFHAVPAPHLGCCRRESRPNNVPALPMTFLTNQHTAELICAIFLQTEI